MQPTDAQLWAAGLGFVLPPVIAIVNQPRWSGAVRGLLMLAVAALVGLGTAYFNGDFDGKPIVTCMLLAAVAIGTSYYTVWKPSGIAPGIERATSTGGTPAPPRSV
jgi:O-antigen/teichoic acid export membrane protein